MRAEHLIDGHWRPGHGLLVTAHDPATGAVVYSGKEAGREEVGAAVLAARQAFPLWARTPLAERIAVARAFAAAIERRGAALAEAISRTMGKTAWEAQAEVKSVIAKVEISIRAQAERAGERTEAAAFGESRLAHRPHGVLAVFGPFNFPAHLPNGHIVPALLAGNAIVFKPSELAPGPAEIMGEAWIEAGLPAGVLNILQGGREVGAALLQERLEGVLFTGSAATGLMIHKMFAGRPDMILALEMGGNNPLIVWEPCDPEAAANLIVHSAFATTGQRCSCARRLILPEGPFGDQVIERLAALADAIRIGPWTDNPQAFMGPLASAGAARNARAFQDAAIERGVRMVRKLGGDGAFVRPAIGLVSAASNLPDEELFAPFLQVYRVRTIHDAFALANATKYGLSGGLICDDAGMWAEACVQMRAGVLNWNRPTTGAASSAPFGGPGLSGNLRPSAYYAADYAAWPQAMQIAPRAAKVDAPGLPA